MTANKENLSDKILSLEDSILEQQNIRAQLSNNAQTINAIRNRGGRRDRAFGSKFALPPVVFNQLELDLIYSASGMLRNGIHIPIDAMFLRPRVITNLDDDQIALVEEVYKEFELESKIEKMMVGKHIYGTTFLVMINNDSLPFEVPINFNKSLEKSLKNAIVLNCFDVSVALRQNQLLMPKFGEPQTFTVSFQDGQQIIFDRSRLFKADFNAPITTFGRQFALSKDKSYGMSQISYVLSALLAEDSTSGNIQSLQEVASVLILKKRGLSDFKAGDSVGNSGSLSEKVDQFNTFLSAQNASVIDSEDDVMRLDVNFSGLAANLDVLGKRLAALFNIPFSIFYSQATAGLNSTGQADQENHFTKVKQRQRRELRPLYEFVDKYVMAHLGIDEDIEFEFPDITDTAPLTIAQTNFTQAQADNLYGSQGIISSQEIRDKLARSGEYELQEGTQPEVEIDPQLQAALDAELNPPEDDEGETPADADPSADEADADEEDETDVAEDDTDADDTNEDDTDTDEVAEVDADAAEDDTDEDDLDEDDSGNDNDKKT